eukprot:TRINITY_DN3093_c0_g1_i3.p1 TRINITY_DN3093_c0_g1~~TRINITY_DN3093_c0_g1_i3.p1  ORF type:complete len:219 (-),score=31.69 TRINITY_DN3093_c0_g1_i3:468-1124(-)
MRDALNKTGRPVFFSLCEWGQDQPATWAAQVGNSWRTTMDIIDFWPSLLWNLDHNMVWYKYAAPGGWNDPDMLEVGNGGMSDVEYKTHFGLWAIMKSPLIVGCDISNMTQATKDILTAPEVIAVNQDDLGVQARVVDGFYDYQIYEGPLADGSIAVLLFNRLTTQQTVTAHWRFLGLADSKSCLVRDLWARKDLGSFSTQFSATLEGHDSSLVKLTCT